jgi:hypothetical protein
VVPRPPVASIYENESLTDSPHVFEKEKPSFFFFALIAQDCDCFGNRWPRRKRPVRLRGNVQAIFCRRRHQPRRPPQAKIRPGSPAPAMGPGTAADTLQIPGMLLARPKFGGKLGLGNRNSPASFVVTTFFLTD